MNKGIEILMARMESNPDEFMGVNNKWVNLMDSYEDHMTEEDRKALYAKYSTLHMDKFTEHVMKKLLAEKEEPVLTPFGQAAMGSAGQFIISQQQAHALNTAGLQAQNSYAGVSSMATGASNSIASNISIGGETLTAKMVKKLKKLIK